MSTIKRYITDPRVVVPAAFIFFLSACSSLRVRTDYAHNVNFTRYHTYSWLRVNAGDSLWEDRIRTDVNTELKARGWCEVPNGGAASIAAFGSTIEQPTLETFYSSFGPGFGGWGWDEGWGGWSSGYATTQVVYTPIGSLTVDILDNANHHLLWRSTSTQVLSEKPQKNTVKLEHAVHEMFEKLPAQPVA